MYSIQMDNNKAIEYISLYMDEIESLKSERDESSNRFQNWRENTESVVMTVFGSESPQFKDIHSFFYPRIIGNTYVHVDPHKKYIHTLECAYNKLSGYKIGLQMMSSSDNKSENSNPTEEVLRICSRFPNVVRVMKKRYSNREPLTINDEYDVQYLLKILLASSFNDIRPEEPCAIFAGSSSRADFFLKNEKILIEAKMTREGFADKELAKQLILDIAQYKTHPDVDSLVCVIYDPKPFIENPLGIKNDLESLSSDNLIVKVIITPN